MTAAWAAVLAATAGVIVAAKPAAWAWRLLRGTARFLDDWTGRERPGVMERLAEVERNIVEVRTQIRPDHGHSMRDVVHQIRQDLSDVKSDVAGVASRIELFEQQRETREKKP